MHRIHIRHLKYFVIVFAVLFFFAGKPVEFGKEKSFFHGFVIPNPVIRIGLGTNLRDVLVRSSAGMNIYEVNSGYALLGEDVAEARVKGEREKLTEKFVLLAAEAKDRKEADVVASGLREKVGGRVFVDESREAGLGGVFQVKVGDFLTRNDALEFSRKLKALGMKDVWILRDFITLEESKPYWALIDNSLQPLGANSVLYFIPAVAPSTLSFNGRDYRGIFILKGSSKGMVLINVLNLEDYLFGVVPGELSPDQFGELEALKAQAVAARTYALKNMGQYQVLGYDLCDTPASQVYGGKSFERPLSSRAVTETRGEVAKYRGELINALYMSTCGGLTEDVENVFAGKPVPYLKSTECIYDKAPEWTIEGGGSLKPVLSAGQDISAGLAGLISLDIIPAGPGPSYFDEPCPIAEAAAWTKRALQLAGKSGPDIAAEGSALDVGELARLFVGAFGWQSHIDNLLLPSEVDHALKDLSGILVPDRRAVAYCIQMGIFPFLASGSTWAGRPLTRAEVGLALTRVMSGYKSAFRSGIFRKASAGIIELEEDSRRMTFKPAPGMFLLRDLDGVRSFASRLVLGGGEKASWLEKDGEIRFLEISFPSSSSLLDRSSRFNRWQVRKSREDLETAINLVYPIGRLKDLTAKKRGPSHRVLELGITGTEGETVARGLKIRSALGLRDTLFDIDREFDSDGRPSFFIFSGRGWGHGVGLCQVGAFGMAQAGAGYKDILKKYYRGVSIEKMR
jgi:stage II sporulation protein D